LKDFKLKNRNLCEEWKGPFTITKVFPNNIALIKTKFGKHEVLYNLIMLKHYHENEIKRWLNHQKRQRKIRTQNLQKEQSQKVQSKTEQMVGQ
jgi:hypothetical protein